MGKVQKIGWILFGGMVIINAAFFPFLPDRMAMQFNSSGVSRTASKPIALLLAPVIMLIVNLIYGKDENKGSKVILTGVILFAINLVGDVANLLLFK